MKTAIIRFMRDEEGATAIEYGVIAGMVTLLIISLFSPTGSFFLAVTALFTRVGTALSTAVP